MNALRYLPNTLSIARLMLVPLTLWMIWQDHWAWAFWVFLGAGISDALDGGLARLLHAQSSLGAWLDPLADKVLVVCVYFCLAITAHLPLWLVVVVVLRDVGIVVYALRGMMVGVSLGAPLLISKINTVVQIILALVVLAQLGFDQLGFYGHSAMITEALVYCVAVTTTASGLAYLFVESKQRSL